VLGYRKNRELVEHLHVVMQVGLTMAGCIAFCFFIGVWLDRWLGTKGLFVSIFIILGVIGGGIVVYRQIMEVVEARDKEENSSSNGK